TRLCVSLQAEVADSQVVPRLERVRIQLRRPLQRIECFRERARIAEQLPQQGELLRVVGVVNAMAGLTGGGQRAAPEHARAPTHVLFRILVFVAQLPAEAVLVSCFLPAPAARVGPRQPVSPTVAVPPELARAAT